MKIGKFSFVDIFQKLWTFADISTCPSERGVFSLSFTTKFEYLRRPCRSGEQIDQETIFEFILPAGVKKNCYPQGLRSKEVDRQCAPPPLVKSIISRTFRRALISGRIG